MPDLDDAVIAALEARARRHRRTLPGEVRGILERAVVATRRAAQGSGRRLHTVHVGRPPSFSPEVICEDGDR